MHLSGFIIRIIVLALPGIIGSLLYRKLRGSKQRKNWQDVVEITLFSLLSYSLYGFIVEIQDFLRLGTVSFTALQALFDEQLPIRWYEIFFASLFGILLAFMASYAHKYKVVNRLGRWVRATNRYGDEDVWDLFHNSPDSDEWVFVRDHKLNLVYFGWIHAFSESELERGLLLSDVQVFSDAETEKHLYNSKVMYIARDRHDLTIEVPQVNENLGGSQQTNDEEGSNEQ